MALEQFLELLISMQVKYDQLDLKDVTLQGSSYSQVSKFIKKTGITNIEKIDRKELLEILETSILIILADLRQNERLGEYLEKFKYFNTDDVLLYLKENYKTEALAMIYQF